MILNDESIMQFGLYKGSQLSDIPDTHRLFLYHDLKQCSLIENTFKYHLFEYLKENKEAIKANLNYE